MPGIVYLIVIAIIAFAAYKIYKGGDFAANDDEFKQAGVKVVFSTGKISIGKYIYDVTDVHGLESERTGMVTRIIIKVDDFKKPIHKVQIDGFGRDPGEKFMQRLSAALRKAGGHSFY